MAWSTWASTKWPMRALAMTGIDTAAMIGWISSGSLMRATPPWARMSAGTRSRAITATAPASSATLAWSAVTTSMMTPPFSISARPRLTGNVPVARWSEVMAPMLTTSDRAPPVVRGGQRTRTGSTDRRDAVDGIGELHPRAAGQQRDRRAGGIEQREALGAGVAQPRALADHAA